VLRASLDRNHVVAAAAAVRTAAEPPPLLVQGDFRVCGDGSSGCVFQQCRRWCMLHRRLWRLVLYLRPGVLLAGAAARQFHAAASWASFRSSTSSSHV